MKWPWTKTEQRAVSPDPSWDILQPPITGTGQYVGAEQAESLSAAYACVQLVSETVASLPLILYHGLADESRNAAEDHPLYSILRSRPNEYQTALEFREMMQAHVMLRGNAYALIDWDSAGNVSSLTPIHPGRVIVSRLPTGRVVYDVIGDYMAGTLGSLDAAGINTQSRRYTQDEILHIKDRTEHGIVGRSRITIARETFGTALAQQEHGNRTFANGARLSGVLQTPHQMTDENIKRLAASWQSQFSGTANSGKTAVLENGLAYQQVAMSLEDAQWIESQQFSVEQVARIFLVPPVMIGELGKGASYATTSELSRHFVKFSLRRWLTMWEQAVSNKLLGPIARKKYFAEHNVEALLRGDALTRAQFYQTGIQSGWLLPSEARRLENLPAVDGIDDAQRIQTTPAQSPDGTQPQKPIDGYPSKEKVYAH